MVGLVVAVADDEVVIGEVEERVGRLEGFECCIWVTGRWFSMSNRNSIWVIDGKMSAY